MAPTPNPTLLRRQLGAELRRIRERADRTVADVGAELGWSAAKLSRIETAHTGIRGADLERLLDLYAIDAPDRVRLAALAGQSRRRAWWEAYGDELPDAYQTFIGFEADATSILTYEAQLVPGLLQTAEYVSAVLQASHLVDQPEIIEQRVMIRLARQAVLTRDEPPQVWVIIDEGALRRPIGGADVLRRQLLWLVEANERPMITIQVLPFSIGAHGGLAGSFVVLQFGDAQPLVYSEGLTGGVFRSKPDDVASYTASFDALRSAALSPDLSGELLKAVAVGKS